MSSLLHRLDALRGRELTRWLWRVPGLPRLYRASRGQMVRTRVEELPAGLGTAWSWR